MTHSCVMATGETWQRTQTSNCRLEPAVCWTGLRHDRWLLIQYLVCQSASVYKTYKPCKQNFFVHQRCQIRCKGSGVGKAAKGSDTINRCFMIYHRHCFTSVLVQTDKCVCVCVREGDLGQIWWGVDGNRRTFLRGQGIMQTLATSALSSQLAFV